MKRIQMTIEDINTTVVPIGFVGENEHTEIVIYWTTLYSDYPSAVATLSVVSPSGEVYPKAITTSGNAVTWEVSAADCAEMGNGQYQLTFTNGTEIIKSYIGRFVVYESIVGEGEAPTPVEDWVYNANEALGEIPGQVKDAADEWLEENISNPDSPPLDRSLSSAVSAAPADLVGDLLNTKAPVITETVTNTPVASVTDGADGMYLHNLTVGIDPVQDLHGQANPYPPGGGKNKVDNSQNTTGYYTATGSYNGSTDFRTTALVPVEPSTQYTASLFNNGSYVNMAFATLWDENGDFIEQKTDATFTTTAETKFVRLRNSTNDSSVVTGNGYGYQLEEGSTATAYAPYSNICPITGWTGCNVTRTGKNRLNWTNTSQTINHVTFTVASDGTVTVNGTATGGDASFYSSNPSDVPFKAGTYILNGCPSGGSNATFTLNETLHSGSDYGSGGTFTLSQDGNVRIRILIRNGFTANNLVFKPMIRLSTISDGTYEPYSGTTYPISWQTEAGTVYGGTLTVNGNGSGNVVVDFVGEDISQMAWEYNGTYSLFQCVTSGKAGTSGQVSGIISTVYKSMPYENNASFNDDYIVYLHTNGSMRIRDTRYTDAQTFKTALAGQMVVYPVASPVEYVISAAQIATLLGVNNIYADTGAIQSVTYPADTKLYIDNKIAELAGNN